MQIRNIKTSLLIITIGLAATLVGAVIFWQDKSAKSYKFCPAKQGQYILPRTYTQKTLFLGYDRDDYHLGFIRSAVKSVIEQELQIDVNILIPRHELDSAYNELTAFRKPPYSNFVNLVLAPADESLWVQDYMETSINMQTGETVLLELPYWEREGEVMPKFVALSKRWDYIQAPQYPDGESHEGADYGGNIEALPYGYILIGETMAKTLKQHLREQVPLQKLLEVPVGWLENSHVDEVFTLLPTSTAPCGFAIGYASPQRALDILQENPLTEELLMPEYDEEVMGPREMTVETPPEDIFAQCFKSHLFMQCKQLIRANNAYHEKIQQGLKIIRKALTPVCPSLQFVALPQLYMPNQMQSEYGTNQDLANAINPNLVNTLLVGKHIYYSWQSYSAFANEAYEVYQKLGLVPRPVVTNVLHHSKGGLHCASLMSHSCEPVGK